MRPLVDADRVRQFMRALGGEVRETTRVYLVGGVSAVLLGWRTSTVDVDLKIIPDEGVLRAIPRLSESLKINVELASPDQFIPPLPGWEDRSRYIAREGKVTFLHFDFYSQALAKIERGHVRDVDDVNQMIRLGLVEPKQALDLFAKIEPELYHYPAIHPPTFRRAVEAAFADSPS
ncbi:MAG: hypothetical protein HYR85_22420 [Planctomycetes bacterium]|nr:hypothetical protein [Planctomycetota bacterium]MBI3844134.1 hypothetical protein [Planctomycetota bacterium]